jgi:Mn2+/Fe2+ NRAMP family transporter
MKWTKVLGWMALLFCVIFTIIYFATQLTPETRATDK